MIVLSLSALRFLIKFHHPSIYFFFIHLFVQYIHFSIFISFTLDNISSHSKSNFTEWNAQISSLINPKTSLVYYVFSACISSPVKLLSHIINTLHTPKNYSIWWLIIYLAFLSFHRANQLLARLYFSMVDWIFYCLSERVGLFRFSHCFHL